MKIILPDAQTVTQGDLSLKPLEQFGEVTVYPLTEYEEIANRVKDAECIICNKTVLNEETLKLAKNLKYIGLFATGYNNIDIEYCNQMGITVCNAGSYSTDAVCQHTFALLLEAVSRVGDYNTFIQKGGWKNSPTFSPFVYPTTELQGKTIGIVGYGSIGKAVAKVANAFNMKVLAYKRTPEKDNFAQMVDFETLLKESDIITVHCPLNKDSEKLFNKNTFNKMKDGVIFINTARGGVLNENDLVDSLQSGKIAFACIDVLETEPMADNCPLLNIENCILTPHIAWAPMETRERLMGIVCDNLNNFLKGTPKNVVNK